ncbi:hypothetical protein LTR92_010928 [Exophiala xenobiotica]|nr:hypothetical protein LTR92_010928 [Exophiala xenobiotica]
MYVSGNDPEGHLVFLGPDREWYHPSVNNSLSVPTEIPASAITISIQGTGQAVDVVLPTDISAGRIWLADGVLEFSVVSTASSNASLVQPSIPIDSVPTGVDVSWGFVEFTYAQGKGLWVNLSYVDFVGLALGMILTSSSPETSSVASQWALGLQSNATSTICRELANQSMLDGYPWGALCIEDSYSRPFRILSPNMYIQMHAEAFADYWTSYIDQEVEHEEVEHEESEIEEEDDSTNRTLRARHSRRAPILPTTRLSRKRPQLDTPTRTPSSKRMRLHDADELEAQSRSSRPSAMNHSIDSSFWDDWDMKRESYAPQEKHANRSIKATRVWRRLASLPSAPSSGRLQQGVSPGRVNTLVKMVLAVANGHAFGALKEVMTFMQRDGRAIMAGVFSQDPKALVSAVNSVDTADNLNSYLRRFALARLARLYSDTVANRGLLGHDKDGSRLSLRTSTNKAYKAEAYVSLIQHIWDVAFPARFRGRNKTRSGLIDSDEPDAVRWNHYKRKLGKQIEGLINSAADRSPCSAAPWSSRARRVCVLQESFPAATKASRQASQQTFGSAFDRLEAVPSVHGTRRTYSS